jgi:urease accessory protein
MPQTTRLSIDKSSKQNLTGWIASLDLTFQHRKQRSVLAKSTQRGPLRVQRAFYPEGDVCHLYILHPPGGVVGGDTLTINVNVEDKAHVVLTTPGATKFYRSHHDTATQTQTLNVTGESSLEWLPQENIFFPGAEAKLTTHIHLEKEARFIGWETQCLGLPVNDEAFTNGHVTFGFSLFRAQHPIILEKIILDDTRIKAPTALRGHPIMSMMVATPATNAQLELSRNILNKYSEHLIAATLVEDCLIIRYIGDSTELSRRIFVQLWTTLRPEIVGKAACPPRIWAT